MKKKNVIKIKQSPKKFQRKLRSFRILRRSPSISQVVDYKFDATATLNSNWTGRCRCPKTIFGGYDCPSNLLSQPGKSYMTIRNQGSYKIKIRINLTSSRWSQGATFDERWNNFVDQSSWRIFETGIISPGGTSGDYIDNYILKPFLVSAYATVGLEVFDPVTNNRVLRVLWYNQNWGSWSYRWLRCGYDYTFTFHE